MAGRGFTHDRERVCQRSPAHQCRSTAERHAGGDLRESRPHHLSHGQHQYPPAQMRVGMIQGVDVSRWKSSDQAGNPLNWAAVRGVERQRHRYSQSPCAYNGCQQVRLGDVQEVRRPEPAHHHTFRGKQGRPSGRTARDLGHSSCHCERSNAGAIAPHH